MNQQKLSEKMKEKNISVYQMYTILGISKSAFYRKCKGITEFKLNEIKKICDVLGLQSSDERDTIFFTEKVS